MTPIAFTISKSAVPIKIILKKQEHVHTPSYWAFSRWTLLAVCSLILLHDLFKERNLWV